MMSKRKHATNRVVDSSDSEEGLSFSSLEESEEEQVTEKKSNSESKEGPSNTIWSNQNLQPIIFDFDESNSGCKAQVDSTLTALDYFQILFPEELITSIAESTNAYRNYLNNVNSNNKTSRISAWTDVTTNEMYCFLATTLLMSHVKKQTYGEYWSTDKLLKTGSFREVMSRDRYINILKCLYFSDPDTSKSEDKLFEIRGVINKLRDAFRSSFYPFKNVCIGEGVMFFKCRTLFKRAAFSKRNRLDIKSFLLRDCSTGYIQDFIMDSGSFNNYTEYYKELGKAGKIVMSLLEPYLQKGHTLYVDDWCTSPLLFVTLYNKKTNACGRVKESRKGMPVIYESVQKNEVAYFSASNLLALKWHDKNETWMLTTCHSADMITTEMIDRQTKQPLKKPTCVFDFYRHMAIVDKTNNALSTMQSARRGLKWYKKYFFHMVDMAVWNSYVLHQSVIGNDVKFTKFHLNVVREIFRKYLIHKVKCETKRTSTDSNNPQRLIERHFPSTYVSSVPTTRNHKRKCVVCTKHGKRRETRYQCEECNVGLCIVPCFETYHTKANY